MFTSTTSVLFSGIALLFVSVTISQYTQSLQQFFSLLLIKKDTSQLWLLSKIIIPWWKVSLLTLFLFNSFTIFPYFLLAFSFSYPFYPLHTLYALLKISRTFLFLPFLSLLLHLLYLRICPSNNSYP